MKFLQRKQPMIASLPMYDFPEVRQATDGFWAALAKALGAEIGLSRPDDWTAAWRNPQLLFSQTCGYPFTHDFSGSLTYVATPCYAVDGCDGPLYRSILFAREKVPLDRFRDKRAAFNNRDSMSGMLALKVIFAPLAKVGQFFSSAIETGGHVASLAAVQNGEADICAVDCVTVAYLRHYRKQALEGLVEVGRSPLVPGLPFVTRCGNVDRLRAALLQTLRNPAHGKHMLITGAEVMQPHSYEVIPDLEQSMERRGGLRLW
jgi:ABC-type phosphate/phosphonate transport system substrate-binding protein